ncbi:unnamed protein product [Boreogadus saida]
MSWSGLLQELTAVLTRSGSPSFDCFCKVWVRSAHLDQSEKVTILVSVPLDVVSQMQCCLDLRICSVIFLQSVGGNNQSTREFESSEKLKSSKALGVNVTTWPFLVHTQTL